MKTLLLDFDGTLIDSRNRLYSLFRELAPHASWTFAEYWDLKRQGLSQSALLRDKLGMEEVEAETFQQNWLDRIEDQDRLAQDLPIAGVGGFLERASRHCRLILVTGRQHADRTHTQIQALGWGGHFSQILVTAQRADKASLIRGHLTLSPEDWMVGDSGEDILAGRELSVRTAGVLTGQLPPDRLRAYGPEIVLDDVTAIEDLL